jgi:hypothetical protein
LHAPPKWEHPPWFDHPTNIWWKNTNAEAFHYAIFSSLPPQSPVLTLVWLLQKRFKGSPHFISTHSKHRPQAALLSGTRRSSFPVAWYRNSMHPELIYMAGYVKLRLITKQMRVTFFLWASHHPLS